MNRIQELIEMGRFKPHAGRETKKGAVHYRNGLNRKDYAALAPDDVVEARAKRPGRAVLLCTVHEPKKVRAHSFGLPHQKQI